MAFQSPVCVPRAICIIARSCKPWRLRAGRDRRIRLAVVQCFQHSNMGMHQRSAIFSAASNSTSAELGNHRPERFTTLRVIYLGGTIAVEKCRDRQRDQAPL
jgi:hypothetical protein